jgi:hypothetical protein
MLIFVSKIFASGSMYKLTKYIILPEVFPLYLFHWCITTLLASGSNFTCNSYCWRASKTDMKGDDQRTVKWRNYSKEENEEQLIALIQHVISVFNDLALLKNEPVVVHI